MQLSKLIENVEVIEVIGDVLTDIKNVVIDSNSVTNGSLFICIKGEEFDGASFIRTAEMYGAKAVVSETKINTSLPQVIVKDARTAMSLIAKAFYLNTCDKMKIIGVVGTNGKTSTAHLIGKILNESGIKCGVIGTLGTYFGNVFYEPTLTTPDPIILHKTLFEMYSSGYDTVVMEVSAHSVYYKKICGIKFAVGVFTNFSQDHLDFFKDMESYRRVKKSFFDKTLYDFAVINADDNLGAQLLGELERTVSYGINNPADVFAIDLKQTNTKTEYLINLFDCVGKVKNRLIGKFNVYNTLAAATACALIGAKPNEVLTQLNSLNAIDGRLQCIIDKEYKVYVDYAHTPDGLENVLKELKSKAKNRLINVFGCGGNRDQGKRSKMGEISAKYADFTVITSDNPRYEEPMDIIYQIEKGVLKICNNYVIVQDRFDAIEYAINMAKAGDVIVVAGKGSENYQEILGVKRLYNDKNAIEEIVRRKSD
ncbi:MAG: UDP-N-acetylmuramoyl-L-alanyl-D-glutamate--2,6-diaminopimelate ligase [Clostridiales bacterium]|nr:UDP-N-acetylmuramoyl-L-alanyl-D-glutamate--2,6-diaminopimelate ligase [Clostridiales bacterium]